MRGIGAVKPGATVGDIGHAIQEYAESNRFSVVRDFCGHGLGRVFHSAPSILHYGTAGMGTTLQKGMFFTIEPMINAENMQLKYYRMVGPQSPGTDRCRLNLSIRSEGQKRDASYLPYHLRDYISLRIIFRD